LFGQEAEGAVLSCSKTLFCRLEVESEGVSCASIDCLGGVTIRDGGSATVVKCTFIDTLNVEEGASLVMEDSRVSSGGGYGIICDGKLMATGCTFERNDTGVHARPWHHDHWHRAGEDPRG